MRILSIVVGAASLLWSLRMFAYNRSSREDMWLAAAFVNVCLRLISSALLMATGHWIFAIGLVIPLLHALVVKFGNHRGEFASATVFTLLGAASIVYGVSSHSVFAPLSAYASAAASILGCALITLMVRAWIRW